MTMSPREKVELKPCPFCGKPDPQIVPYPGSESDVWCRNSDCDGHAVSIDAWNRRATLASSGDHAELARLAEAANVEMPSKRRSGWYRRQSEFAHAANPATVLALIAENAALRGERDTWKQLAENGAAGAAQHIDRATEAERKLAEDADIFVELTLHHDLTPAMKDRLETLMQSRETTND